jgi:hypothetical protein
VAGDLIPPPSPSGRPSPDAMRNVSRRGNAELVEVAEPEPAAAPAPSQFRSRFGFVLGALLGISVAALAAFALLLGTKPSKPASEAGVADHWSSWFPPSGDIVSGPAAIADHVQAQYKRADGKQLVIVHGGPFFFAGAAAPLPFAVRLQPSDGTIRDLGSNGVLYTLSGTGTSGTIVGDKSTPARQRLLRREALELALYSFRYVSNITMFVALLPTDEPKPKNGKKPKPVPVTQQTLQAVFFRPGDLKPQLKSPLTTTLKPRIKLGPKELAAAEGKRVDALTNGNLFKAHFVQQVDGQLYLVLKSSR